MNINKSIFICLFLLVFSGASYSEGANEIDPGLAKSQAILHAADRFISDGYQWQDYRLIVEDHGTGIDVIFVPPVMSGNDPWTAKPSTLPEVHYYLDSSGKTIIRHALGK